MTTPPLSEQRSVVGADLDRFLDLSTDLFCVAGFDGYFRLLSPSWTALLGYSEQELTSRPCEEFVHVDDRAATAAELAGHIDAGAVSIRFVNRYRHQDGSYRTLSWNAAPDAERGVIYAVARCLDEQLDAARAIEESEALFRGAFEQSLVGMAVAEVTHPDDLAGDATDVQDQLAGRLPGLHREKRCIRPDGTTVSVSLSTTLVRGQQGAPSHLVTQVLDVTGQRAAADALASTAAMLDGIVQNSQSLVYVKDLDGVYLLANRPFLEAFGVTEQDLIGRDDSWLDADLEPVWRVNDLRARDGAYRLQEWSGHGEDQRWYESVKFPLLDASGHPYATCGVSLEVTELTRQREEARKAGAFSAAVLAASPDAIVVHDLASGRLVYASRTAAGLPAHAAADADVHPDDRVRLQAALTACGDLEDEQVLQVRYRVLTETGAPRWLSRRLTAFRRGPDGRATEVLSVIRDVSEMVAAEDQLQHDALHDPLTGLPNRALLTDRLSAALARAQRLGQDVAVLYCDLDGFKRVNDANGHAAGDLLLRETADRLRSVLRPQDTAARVGGDEFVIVLETDGTNAPRSGTPDRRGAPDGRAASPRTLGIHVAQRIVAALTEPVLIAGVEHVVSVSVGLAYAGGPGSARTAEDVLQDADAAMYRAKAAGKDRFEVFENALRTDLAERGRVERLLRCALQVAHPRGVPSPRLDVAGGPRLEVAYQPVYGGVAGRLEGFEALARLTDDAGRPVAPDLFIAVAEDTGLIRPLGHEVLRQACRQLVTWRQRHAHAEHLTVAVNLSARQAQHPALADEVMTVLAEEGLPPDRLVLELTESVLLQAGRSTISMFHQLRNAGIGISIDDFGTGYASLRYLAELPVTAVKIDRSFTAGLPDDATCASIVRAVAGLARDLDLQCVVEGVETAQQLKALPLGVSVQGYLLGRPGTVTAGSAAIETSSARLWPPHCLPADTAC